MTAVGGQIPCDHNPTREGLPIVIGITGHRNPAKQIIPDLERKFKDILNKIDTAAPNTPIILVSPLAAGCDQLAAQWALEFPRKLKKSIKLVVVMPLALDDYRMDFKDDPAGLASFEALRKQASAEFALPAAENCQDEHGCISCNAMRAAHYRRLGLYLALHSEIMVAMWNGQRNGKVGGTAEIVDFCLGKATTAAREGTPEYNAQFVGSQIPFRPTPPVLARSARRKLLVLATQRTDEPTIAIEAQDREKENELIVRELCDNSVKDIDFLNQKLDRIVPKFLSAFKEASPRKEWQSLVCDFEHFDALAIEAKKKFMLRGTAIALLAVVGIICFQCFSSSYYSSGIYLYLLFIFSAYVVWVVTKKSRWEWTFIQSRGIAEAMRVQLAWVLAGIDQCVADHYLSRRGEEQEIEFIQTRMRAIAIRTQSLALHEKNMSLAMKYWVEDQFSYTRQDSNGNKRRHNAEKRRTIIAKYSIWIILIMAFVLSVAQFCFGDESKDVVEYGCVIVGSVLAIAGGFQYQRGIALDREELDTARRMHPLFGRALKIKSEKQILDTDLLRALGKEALDENAEWLSRHSDCLPAAQAG